MYLRAARWDVRPWCRRPSDPSRLSHTYSPRQLRRLPRRTIRRVLLVFVTSTQLHIRRPRSVPGWRLLREKHYPHPTAMSTPAPIDFSGWGKQVASWIHVHVTRQRRRDRTRGSDPARRLILRPCRVTVPAGGTSRIARRGLHSLGWTWIPFHGAGPFTPFGAAPLGAHWPGSPGRDRGGCARCAPGPVAIHDPGPRRGARWDQTASRLCGRVGGGRARVDSPHCQSRFPPLPAVDRQECQGVPSLDCSRSRSS